MQARLQNKRTYYLYVIALKRSALKDKRCIKQNPNYEEGPYSRCYYVGASIEKPEVRYEKHISQYRNKEGYRTGSSIVRKHGFKRNGLRPKQYEHLNPVYASSFEEVVQKEAELAEKLRKRKHFVYQN